MKLLPLIIHAGIQVPRWTSLFSDTLPVATLAVTPGGNAVLTCSSAHGITVGTDTAISVTDALAPNPITAASVLGDGTVLLTTEYPHNLSASPDATRFRAYSTFARMSGFASALINGIRDLVATPTPTTLVISPGDEVASITLNGAEVLLENLEFEMTGWHKATATTTTVLTFPAPDTVTRAYTVTSPTVVTNIRVYGAIDHEAAIRMLSPDGDLLEIDKGHLFILPQRVRAKSKFNLTSAHPGADYRQEIDDGFTLLAVLPSAGDKAHVGALDRCQGEVFKAVLQSFQGLKVLRGELCAPGSYVAMFDSHQGGVHANNAVYVHEYVFKAPFQINNLDALAPYRWTLLDDVALDGGAVPDSIYAEGSAPFGSVLLTGIFHKDHASPLSGSYTITTTEAE